MNSPNSEFWNKKKVLITGHTGFKGSWLKVWLEDLGADLLGLSFNESKNNFNRPYASNNIMNIDSDLNSNSWQKTVTDFRPEIVFHLAAQSLVLEGYKNPIETFKTNVGGTINLLSLISELDSVKTSLIVTTDKVYLERDNHAYKKEDSLIGGSDPYSASKSAVELIVSSLLKAKNSPLSTVRSGNVIGGGDWSYNRLIPEIVNHWHKSETLELRSPNGVSPWLHVLEPIRGYLLFAEYLHRGGLVIPAMNFAPSFSNHVPVNQIAQKAFSYLPSRSGFKIMNSSDYSFIETEVLKLDSDLANKTINWRQLWNWEISLEKTLDWYTNYLQGADQLDLIKSDLSSYLHDLAYEKTS